MQRRVDVKETRSRRSRAGGRREKRREERRERKEGKGNTERTRLGRSFRAKSTRVLYRPSRRDLPIRPSLAARTPPILHFCLFYFFSFPSHWHRSRFLSFPCPSPQTMGAPPLRSLSLLQHPQ